MSLTDMSGDMAETSVTDSSPFKAWSGPPMFGPDHASNVVGFSHMPGGNWRLWYYVNFVLSL